MKNIFIVFSLFSSILFAQNLPFDQAKTLTIYESWTNYDTGIRTTDVVNLRGGWDGFTNFCDQVFSTPS